MDDSIGEYIGYLVFFIFFVLPRLLKVFAGKKGKTATAPSPSQTLEELLTGQTVEPEKPTFSPAEREAYRTAIRNLVKKKEAVASECADLIKTALARGGNVRKMKEISEATLLAPLGKLDSRIRKLEADIGTPKESEIHKLGAVLEKLQSIMSILIRLTEQRLKPDRDEILAVLDAACKEALVPFRIHAGRMNIAYPTRYVLSVMDDAGDGFAQILESTKIAVAVVDRRQADLPKAWVNLISDIGVDVCHSIPGLHRRLRADLGTVAPPVSIVQYQNPRLLIGGLLGGWINRIFGDVAAALYLGPGSVSGLAVTREGEDPLSIVIGKGQSLTVPAHIRVFTAARTLSLIGFKAPAQDAWETWQRQQGSPDALSITDTSGKTVTVPTAPVLEVMERVVDYLVTDPIPGLGNYPMSHIPSLKCDNTTYARMKEMVPYLINGEPRNAPTRVIIGAALLAQQKSATMERKIGNTAIDAMAGKGEVMAAPPIPGTAAAPSILDVRSPELAMEAMALGAAFAPRRGNPFSK